MAPRKSIKQMFLDRSRQLSSAKRRISDRLSSTIAVLISSIRLLCCLSAGVGRRCVGKRVHRGYSVVPPSTYCACRSSAPYVASSMRCRCFFLDTAPPFGPSFFSAGRRGLIETSIPGSGLECRRQVLDNLSGASSVKCQQSFRFLSTHGSSADLHPKQRGRCTVNL